MIFQKCESPFIGLSLFTELHVSVIFGTGVAIHFIDFTRNHKFLKKSSADFDQYHMRHSQVRYAKVTIAASNSMTVLCENLEKV